MTTPSTFTDKEPPMNTLNARIYYRAERPRDLPVADWFQASLPSDRWTLVGMTAVELADAMPVAGRPPILERFFAALNGFPIRDDEPLARLYAGERSMSVGDGVILGEVGWLCDRVGWVAWSPSAEQLVTA